MNKKTGPDEIRAQNFCRARLELVTSRLYCPGLQIVRDCNLLWTKIQVKQDNLLNKLLNRKKSLFQVW